jgi:hypothetical protein
LDRKVKFTPEVVGAAAAFEAWKVFERDPAHKPAAGGKLAHTRAKQVSVIVMAMSGMERWLRN